MQRFPERISQSEQPELTKNTYRLKGVRNMKRFFAILLVLCMMLPMAVAEEENRSVLDTIGGWFRKAWEDTSGWVSQAWENASKWMKGAWGDASKWVEQAWNESSQWVIEIWGDVSTWASETYENASGSIGAWWTKTFNTVTETTSNLWGWLAEETAALQSETREILSSIKEAVMTNDGDAETKVKSVFFVILKKLNINDEDSQKVWNTIEAYAKQKGISKLAVSRLALPYLLQLIIDSMESQSGIPAIAIAQYLTAIVEKLNINSTDTANQLIEQLNEVLGGI